MKMDLSPHWEYYFALVFFSIQLISIEVYLLMEELIFPLARLGFRDFRVHGNHIVNLLY